jgi:glycosyltransferase involved in cell wall biosynthesis
MRMAGPKRKTPIRKIPKNNPFLTVVVPIYNEVGSLPDFLPRLVQYCRARNWKLILINDGSRDNSLEILKRHESPPQITVISHKVNRGYGGALKSGIAAADTTYVVTIDGDGQHNPEDIDGLLALAMEKDADLVVGNRGQVRNTDWYREIGKWFIRRFTRILMPLPIHDLNSGFKLYDTKLAQKYLDLCPDSMAFSDVVTLIFINQHNLVLEHEIRVNQRQEGKSSINTLTAVETVIEILNLTMMFNPLRIFLPLSVICIGFGLLWGTRIVLLGRGVSVGAMLAIVTGLLFFVIGLIASQLAAIRMGLYNNKQ